MESTLAERFNAVDEIMRSPDTKLVTLRGLLADRKIPDLAKGLSRVQSGKVSGQFEDSIGGGLIS